MSYDYDDEYYYSPDFWDKRQMKKKLASINKHVPNKNEAKLLRKLMSENNLTEDEVRSIKKYRILLSIAQKEGAKRNTRFENDKKIASRIIKRITRELKLPKEHPLVIQAFKTKWEAETKNYIYRYSYKFFI